MKKLISLFKANTKGDMSIFKYKGEGKNKLLFFGFLTLVVMFSVYTYADMICEPLHEIGLSYIVITLFALAIVFMAIMEGVYKSQGILFDAKDNNLLFPLPIKKSHILTVRIIKILLFEYMFELLFMIPCYIRYITYEGTSLYFYLISIIFLIVLPLIPLVISCIIGYLIKYFSVSTKHKKIVQTFISLIFVLVIFALSFSLQGLISNIASHAKSINEIISKLYLPIGLYIDLISKFDIVKFLELILISIVPFILFVIIFQVKYDKIINSSKESSSLNKSRKGKIKCNSIISSLTKKELKNYFSIPTYIVNTIIGPVIAIIASISIVFKYDSMVDGLLENPEINIDMITSMLPLFIIGMVIVLSCMTSITSSSISLEGKRKDLMMSLPVKPSDIFLSKIYTSDIIVIPAMIISSIILIIKFKVFSYFIFFIIFTCIMVPHVTAQIGLLCNLKYPKLDYNSEVEVIKQSFSVVVSMLIAIIFAGILIIGYIFISKVIGSLFTLILESVLVLAITYILNFVLNTYGVKKFYEL